jgi:uncharacterized protein YjbJ (UPF0337 family)
MNKKQIKGHYEEAKGKVKEVAGHVVGNEELELEGKLQKNAGKIQAGVGDVEAEIEDAAAEIKKDS